MTRIIDNEDVLTIFELKELRDYKDYTIIEFDDNDDLYPYIEHFSREWLIDEATKLLTYSDDAEFIIGVRLQGGVVYPLLDNIAEEEHSEYFLRDWVF